MPMERAPRKDSDCDLPGLSSRGLYRVEHLVTKTAEIWLLIPDSKRGECERDTDEETDEDFFFANFSCGKKDVKQSTAKELLVCSITLRVNKPYITLNNCSTKSA